MKELSNLAKKIKPSATVEITSLAKDLLDKGEDIIVMSVGEPDFDTPIEIKKSGIDAINSGFTKYTQASGITQLKELVANRYFDKYNIKYTHNNIVLSNGGKHALFNALSVILNSEDEVIIPPIHWVSYIDLVKFFNATPIVPEGNSAIYDFDNLESHITNKTKAIIINSPSNPTGEIFSRDDLIKLSKLVEKYDLFVISDEIYDDIVYDNLEINSIASLSNKLKENTIIINGFSKSYSMTGWRLGYSISNQQIANAISKIQGQTTNHPSTISQHAALKFTKCDKNIKKMVDEYSKRRNIVNDLLKNIDNISYKTPKGAFYYFINISNIYNKQISSSTEFCKYLLKHYKVALVPGIAFGNDNFVRISFAMDEENLKEGINRLINGIKSLKE